MKTRKRMENKRTKPRDDGGLFQRKKENTVFLAFLLTVLLFLNVIFSSTAMVEAQKQSQKSEASNDAGKLLPSSLNKYYAGLSRTPNDTVKTLNTTNGHGKEILYGSLLLETGKINTTINPQTVSFSPTINNHSYIVTVKINITHSFTGEASRPIITSYSLEVTGNNLSSPLNKSVSGKGLVFETLMEYLNTSYELVYGILFANTNQLLVSGVEDTLTGYLVSASTLTYWRIKMDKNSLEENNTYIATYHTDQVNTNTNQTTHTTTYEWNTTEHYWYGRNYDMYGNNTMKAYLFMGIKQANRLVKTYHAIENNNNTTNISITTITTTMTGTMEGNATVYVTNNYVRTNNTRKIVVDGTINPEEYGITATYAYSYWTGDRQATLTTKTCITIVNGEIIIGLTLNTSEEMFREDGLIAIDLWFANTSTPQIIDFKELLIRTNGNPLGVSDGWLLMSIPAEKHYQTTKQLPSNNARVTKNNNSITIEVNIPYTKSYAETLGEIPPYGDIRLGTINSSITGEMYFMPQITIVKGMEPVFSTPPPTTTGLPSESSNPWLTVKFVDPLKFRNTATMPIPMLPQYEEQTNHIYKNTYQVLASTSNQELLYYAYNEAFAQQINQTASSLLTPQNNTVIPMLTSYSATNNTIYGRQALVIPDKLLTSAEDHDSTMDLASKNTRIVAELLFIVGSKNSNGDMRAISITIDTMNANITGNSIAESVRNMATMRTYTYDSGFQVLRVEYVTNIYCVATIDHTKDLYKYQDASGTPQWLLDWENNNQNYSIIILDYYVPKKTLGHPEELYGFPETFTVTSTTTIYQKQQAQQNNTENEYVQTILTTSSYVVEINTLNSNETIASHGTIQIMNRTAKTFKGENASVQVFVSTSIPVQTLEIRYTYTTSTITNDTGNAWKNVPAWQTSAFTWNATFKTPYTGEIILYAVMTLVDNTTYFSGITNIIVIDTPQQTQSQLTTEALIMISLAGIATGVIMVYFRNKK